MNDSHQHQYITLFTINNNVIPHTHAHLKSWAGIHKTSQANDVTHNKKNGRRHS